MKSRLLMLALMMLGAACQGGVKIGQAAPEFEATDILGKAHKLSGYKGKIVVVESYNLDCPFCANHFKTGAMQELQEEMTSQGVIWLMVNSTHKGHSSYRDAAAASKEFKELGMKATAWIDDSSGRIGKAYGLRTTPHVVVIDGKGEVAYEGAIDDRPAVGGDPRKARNYVREAVKSLKMGVKLAVTRTKSYGCAVKYGE